MVDNLDEVHKVLNKMSKQFKDTFSTFGSSLDGSPTYEDNAVFLFLLICNQTIKVKSI